MLAGMTIRDKLKGWARRIKRDGVTLWFAGKHPATPWYAKALGLFVVAYALSPIDLIPDFIQCSDLWMMYCCSRVSFGWPFVCCQQRF